MVQETFGGYDAMKLCDQCGRPLLIERCSNSECKSSTQTLPTTRHSRRKTAQKVPRQKNALPDLTKPIPSSVNSSKYTSKSCKSLLVYLKYSRANGQTDEIRQRQLGRIIEAGPLIPSSENKRYITSFDEPNSRKRVEAIISLLEWHIQGRYWVYKDLERHKKHLPFMDKSKADIDWLNSILGQYE